MKLRLPASRSARNLAWPALVISTFLLLCMVGCQQPDSELPRTILSCDEVRVPLYNSHGQLFVIATVGTTTLPFMIDTGNCSSVFLNQQVASTEGLKLGSPTYYRDFAGFSAAVTHARIHSLIMGGIRLKELDAVVVEVAQFRSGAEAVLGQPAFSDVLLTIDYAQNQLVLRRGELPPTNGIDILGMGWDSVGHPTVEAMLNGKDLHLCPDSGCTQSCITLSKAQALALNLRWRSPPVPVMSRTTLGEASGVRGQVDCDLTVGGYKLANPTVLVLDSSNTIGSLGSEMLCKFEVTFDFKKMRIRLERAPMLVPTFFLDLSFRSDRRRVIALDPGGPADKAGIRIGDEIVLMNGEANTIIERGASHKPGTEIEHGPVTICGPATWNLNGYTSEIPEGQEVNFPEGVTVTVTYHPQSSTKPSTRETGTEPRHDSALIMNWPVGGDGPLPLQVRRGGRLIWISLPINHPGSD